LPLDARTELVTPTGAALLTTLATFERPAMRVRQVGYGFGTKTFAWPNMLRVWIGEAFEGRMPGSWAPVQHEPHEHGAQAAVGEHGIHEHPHPPADSHTQASHIGHNPGHIHPHPHPHTAGGHAHDEDHAHPHPHIHESDEPGG
jgi:pyridinium-3,5-bisthiocarboxylic acid mononucleotide nickel chelatase